MGNQKDDKIEIDLLRLIRALWKRAWTIVLSMAIVGGLTLGYALLFVAPEYAASAFLYVNSSNPSQEETRDSISQAELTAAKSLVNTYVVILNTRTTLNEVIEQAGVPYSYDQLQEMITAQAVNGTEIFEIRVTSRSPEEAARIANTIARILPEKIAAIVEGTSARIVDMAVQPSEQASLSNLEIMLLGMLAGAVLSAAYVIIGELLDDRIHAPDDLLQTYDLPMLAAIPDSSGDKKGPALANMRRVSSGKNRKYNLPSGNMGNLSGPKLNFSEAEAYKLLRTNLSFSLSEESGCKIIGVTSALPGEGKTTSAINLAYTMSQTGKKVLLLEADLRLPAIARSIGAGAGPGVSDLLTGQCQLTEALQKAEGLGKVWFIASGRIPTNPSELLASKPMGTLIRVLAGKFDVIVVDLPPVEMVSDVMILSKLLSGLVLVVRRNYCTQGALKEALRKLSFSECKLLGFAMRGCEI